MTNAKQEIKVGSIVKFITTLPDEDANGLMEVLEVMDPRARVRYLGTGMELEPTGIVNLDELTLA